MRWGWSSPKKALLPSLEPICPVGFKCSIASIYFSSPRLPSLRLLIICSDCYYVQKTFNIPTDGINNDLYVQLYINKQKHIDPVLSLLFDVEFKK